MAAKSLFDPAAVRQLLERAAAEKWPYPRVFDALRDRGVTHYDTQVALHKIVYAGEGGTLTEGAPAGFRTLAPAEQFDEKSFKTALARAQRRETTYPEFLREIAAAGIHTYHVDVAARTVTYKGARGESVVEPVPPYKPA